MCLSIQDTVTELRYHVIRMYKGVESWFHEFSTLMEIGWFWKTCGYILASGRAPGYPHLGAGYVRVVQRAAESFGPDRPT